MRRNLNRATVAIGAGVLAAAAVAVAGTSQASAASPDRVVVAGEAPIGATPENAVGAVAASTSLSVDVSLPLRAGAEAFARAVSTPGSPSYGRYETPAAFDARFAPTPAQVAAVSAWLRSAGFTVTAVPSNRRYVSATGTAAAARSAFGTTVQTYRYHGRTFFAPTSAVSVPASLSGDVLAVDGLDDATVATTDHVPADAGTTTAAASAAAKPATDPIPAPCSTYYGQHHVTLPAAYRQTSFPTNICGYDAAQLQSAYGVTGSGYDGTGVTMAIIDAYASPTIVSDARAEAVASGIAPLTSHQFTQVLPAGHFDKANKCAGEAGWNLEETLDVESSHAVAPGANIVYVAGQNCAGGLFEASNAVVADHLASVVSNSYSYNGEPALTYRVKQQHAVLVQAAAEGIGFNYSSGDDGDLLAATGQTGPSYAGTDPYATGVGGTSLAINKNGKYESETGWGNDRAPVAYSSSGQATGYTAALPGAFYAGAGGGTSRVFAQPTYQAALVPTGLSELYGSSPARVEPDVSADADPYTGFRIYLTSGGTLVTPTYGGTSLASPLFTAEEAVADQGRFAPIGFANPLLYSLGYTVFRDIKPASVQVALAAKSGNPASPCVVTCLITQDHDTSLQTAAGYDDVTGLGSPMGKAFLTAVRSGR